MRPACSCSCPAGSQLDGQLARPEFISVRFSFLRRFSPFRFASFNSNFNLQYAEMTLSPQSNVHVVLHVVDIFIRCGLKTVAAFFMPAWLPLSGVISAWPSALKKHQQEGSSKTERGTGTPQNEAISCARASSCHCPCSSNWSVVSFCTHFRCVQPASASFLPLWARKGIFLYPASACLLAEGGCSCCCHLAPLGHPSTVSSFVQSANVLFICGQGWRQSFT